MLIMLLSFLIVIPYCKQIQYHLLSIINSFNTSYWLGDWAFLIICSKVLFDLCFNGILGKFEGLGILVAGIVKNISALFLSTVY